MDFGYSQRTQDLQARVSAFMDEHVYPAEARYADELRANTEAGKRWTPLEGDRGPEAQGAQGRTCGICSSPTANSAPA